MAIHITSQTKSLRLRPTSNAELRSLIEQELERQGPDADLNFIDVSFVKDMSYLFEGLDIRNIKIDQWDTSNAEDMSGMFEGCDEFVGTGLENWDVGNVYNMSHMFEYATLFNGNLWAWDTSNVVHMSWMFQGATSFIGTGIGRWDTHNVVYMYRMFQGAKAFTGDGIEKWDVRGVVDMRWMFYGATSFNRKLPDWNLSNCKKMNGMFDHTNLDIYTVFYKQIPTMPY